jgi:hypothetical protein
MQCILGEEGTQNVHASAANENSLFHAVQSRFTLGSYNNVRS